MMVISSLKCKIAIYISSEKFAFDFGLMVIPKGP